jgi:hypothetical protein
LARFYARPSKTTSAQAIKSARLFNVARVTNAIVVIVR